MQICVEYTSSQQTSLSWCYDNSKEYSGMLLYCPNSQVSAAFVNSFKFIEGSLKIIGFRDVYRCFFIEGNLARLELTNIRNKCKNKTPSGMLMHLHTLTDLKMRCFCHPRSYGVCDWQQQKFVTKCCGQHGAGIKVALSSVGWISNCKQPRVKRSQNITILLPYWSIKEPMNVVMSSAGCHSYWPKKENQEKVY